MFYVRTSVNKSHAAAYAVVAYLTAYLAYYYPTEYFAALMNSVNKDRKRVAQYIHYCENVVGIEVLPPDINASTEEFVPLPDKKIAFSLSAKSTRIDALDGIIKERETNGPFKSVEDLILRCPYDMSKQTFEALVAIGALNSLGVVKSRYMAALDDIFDRLSKVKAAEKRFNTPLKSGKARVGNFDFAERLSLADLIPEINEYPKSALLKLEKSKLGLYLSGHPLHDYAFAIQNISNFKTSDLDYIVDEDTGEIVVQSNIPNNKSIQFIGLLSELITTTTKKKELMAIAEVEDLEGSCKMLIFPRDFAGLKDRIAEDEIYKITGKTSIKQDEAPCIICTNLEPVKQLFVKRVILECKDGYEAKLALDDILKDDMIRGNNPLYLCSNGLKVLVDKEYWVHAEKFCEKYIFAKIKEW